MAALSLIILALVIAIACWKQLNAGVMAIVGTFFLLVLSGIGTDGALANFNGTLFIQYAMVMLVYGIPSYTGAMNLGIKKVLKRTGDKMIRYLPLALYTIGLVCSLAGAGGTIFGALLIITAVLGPNLGLNPILMPVMMLLGANAGTLHPNHQAGLVALSVTTPLGHADSAWTLYFVATILATLFAIVVYIVLKGYKVNISATSLGLDEDLPKFTRPQILSLIGMLVQILLSNFTSWEIGMTAAVIIVAEILLGVISEKDALTKVVSYPTLIMVCGMSVLIKQVQALGGIELIVTILEPIITKLTVTPIVALMSGMLSWVSSTMAVVMPTIIPLLDGFSASVGNAISFNTLLCACVSSSHMAAISPMSTGGGSIMAYVSSQDPKANTGVYFRNLFICSVFGVMFNVILSLLGVVGFFANMFT